MWAPERVEALVWLWAEGFSARWIANKLGGITRNAVIGKAYRLNLQRGAIVPEPKLLMIEEPPQTEVELGMCRWGLNVCSGTAQPGRHYCAEHLTLTYLERKRLAETRPLYLLLER
jgi:GcrA cell cycle regulator